MTIRENRSRNKNVDIARKEAAMIDDTVAEGNLVRIKQSKFLSLVDLPANTTGFKVVRSAEPPKGEVPMTKPVIRRTRRSDVQPVLALTFPEGTKRADVDTALTTYGMAGYNVTETEGVFRAVRGDLQSIAPDAIDIKLNDAGVIATVSRGDIAAQPENGKDGIALAAIEFDTSKFDEAKIADWLQRNSIDSKIAETENSDQAYVVRRSAVPENEETRRMELEDGVTAIIVRSDENDIPDGYYAAVSETAYGSWGWGQLDFVATIADIAFSEQMREGLSALDNVLRNILLYSPLPIDARKALVMNALSQYGTFVNAIMDSLPRQLLVSVVRSAQPQLENSMTKATEGGATQPAATQTPAVPATPAAEAPLTRADIATMIAEGVATALKQTSATPAAEPAKVEEPKPEAALTRADVVAALSEVVKPLVERMEKVEGATVLRSANPDAPTEPVKPVVDPTAKPDSNTIFRGAFPGIAGRKAAS